MLSSLSSSLSLSAPRFSASMISRMRDSSSHDGIGNLSEGGTRTRSRFIILLCYNSIDFSLLLFSRRETPLNPVRQHLQVLNDECIVRVRAL